MDGIAHFLIQTNALNDVVLIEVQKGDIIVISLGYGHTTGIAKIITRFLYE